MNLLVTLFLTRVSKNILVIIPARMGSSRFPGKPMYKINNIPMIEHVYKNVTKNNKYESFVATCDNEIYNHIESINGNAVYTSISHERASDRCAEALIEIEKKGKKKFDIVVMVQGDEPMVNEKMIEESLSPLVIDKNIFVTNLYSEIKTKEELEDRNCIKVVHDNNFNALYFSRQPIPYQRNSLSSLPKKQVCVISFQRDFLLKYVDLQETPLEKSESVDMMRVLEHGYKVKLIKTNYQSFAVDTKDDIKKVEKFLIN